MSKIIVGIHGLGNKVPENVLTRWWESSIIEGLGHKMQESPSFDFQLVYWAHYLHPVPLDPTLDDKKHHLYVNDPYIPASHFHQEEKGSDFRRKLLDYLGEQMDRIFLNEDLSINFSSINDFIIHHFFSDLEVYYHSDEGAHATAGLTKREQVCRHLADLLRQHKRKEILLIAHSMGSIVAYDVLTRYTPDIEIDTLVTIGSPLGIPIIRSRIGAEMMKNLSETPILKTPENVKNGWYNLTDLRDKIGFFGNLKDDFEANSRGVRVVDQMVYNNYDYRGEKNPHKAYGYLRTPQLSDIINEFIRRKRPAALARLQTFIKDWSRQWLRLIQRHR